MNLIIPDFSKIKMAVVGDVMLDRYWTGNTKRISPEAPVPVVHVNDIKECPGGAGNVAMNLKSLGVHTSLYGIIGRDEAGARLLNTLQHSGIENHLQQIDDLPTITKLRVLSLHQQLIRLDFEETFANLSTPHIHHHFLQNLPQYHAIILSDYHKGTLTDSENIIRQAKAHNVLTFADPKGESFEKYRGVDVITPNRKEFEMIVGQCRNDEELVNKAQRVLHEHQIGALLVTRGSEGMSLIREHHAPIHLPARAFEVLDVTGAGDTVIAVLAASLAAGSPIEIAMYLANVAAGITVQHLGAAQVSVSELRRVVRKQQFSQLGVLSEEEAILATADAKERGEKVVMTNGCFDILHPGHIGYLEAAKQQGHRLLVAVNSDDSIRRIKGEGRPIKNLADRMAILAGLRAVDWVVPFYEDTPENLIKKITPNVLVKGIDYQVHEIAGHQHVLEHGGEVKLVGPEKNWSSTELIERIKKIEVVS
ncbi:MAG: bifunctional D-glycero-beta-D-manno-heptose-7-phosphate kinase/D-glycero-beta-D-manno-heptose 1-phosphate adenylyltransferase HldE [Legionellales bacterium]|nr:bifunctional D-glycero-beta-D-manno-heptose-7-phosphate kinase/D-glycero-beta-D-manno-heptose 1-phosphate adenylyltransferase HldE [Legionellales bacterium]